MKVCFVASRFPYPITKGDTLRAYHQIRELSREHSVHLVTACEVPPEPAALAEMKKYCESIDVVRIGKARSFANLASRGLASRLPLQVLYFLSPHLQAALLNAVAKERFDVIHAMTVRVAPAVFRVNGVPVVVDFMDSFAANIATRRELVKPVVRRLYDLELARVAQYEREVARLAAGGFVIAEHDRDAIGDKNLAVIPNGVDAAALAFKDTDRDSATLIFTGNMGYQPNVDAVLWFVADCWPLLRQKQPNLKFQIVGARPAPAIVALARKAGIEVVGRVASMAPYLHRATVSVCPIRCGSGMQNKVLEAMAAGVPVVTTSFANRSIRATHGRDVRVADTAVDFTGTVLQLIGDNKDARRQAAEARRLVEEEYTWARRSAQIVKLYYTAIASYSQEYSQAI